MLSISLCLLRMNSTEVQKEALPQLSAPPPERSLLPAPAGGRSETHPAAFMLYSQAWSFLGPPAADDVPGEAAASE